MIVDMLHDFGTWKYKVSLALRWPNARFQDLILASGDPEKEVSAFLHLLFEIMELCIGDNIICIALFYLPQPKWNQMF